MDRELLLEIGCEEIPAGWLPDLTQQVGEVFAAQLREHRLPPESPVETYSTPRRLTVRIVRVPERQTDFEELVTGPPTSAGFKPDGSPTPAALGFAAKQGIEVTALERVSTPKGEYLAHRKRLRSKTTADVLPDVLGGTLRGLTFPKLMRWDAALDDGRGDLLFGRPIRWVLFIYGGRVVPFSIARTPAAESGQVQEVVSGAVTYGHRFLTTSGRAGRAIKVRSFDEYHAKLLENFVVLERSERSDKIARELDVKALRLKGRVSRVAYESGLLREVPDLVEYPAVVAGTFASEFTDVLPQEVLTTTLIHHQHYFPVEDDEGKLKPAFLAVINTEPENERTIAINAERVVTARLRDALFFWQADRAATLESRIDRLATLTFHKKVGSYRDKIERIEPLAAWIAREALGAPEGIARLAGQAARLAKADLTTDMVRELTELQGIMGGIYAREEGLPEEVWKAVYFHYLPIGVEPDAPPTRAQLGNAALTWAAVSLADKLDTVVGLFAAGERPTGSRDPFGLRRAGQAVVKILVDLPDLGIDRTPTLKSLVEKIVRDCHGANDAADTRIARVAFWFDRLGHLLRERGVSDGAIRAVLHRPSEDLSPLDLLRRARAMDAMRTQVEFLELARLFKRVNNIVQDKGSQTGTAVTSGHLRDLLVEPAERELRDAFDRVGPSVRSLAETGRYPEALKTASTLAPFVDRFFVDILVMADDRQLREARLALLGELRDLVWDNIGDIPALVQQVA